MTTQIVDLILAVGFPAFTFIAMLKLYNDTRKENREDRTQMTKALNENTNVISELKIIIQERLKK